MMKLIFVNLSTFIVCRSIRRYDSAVNLSQLAMRSLCPDHFVAHKSFLHTWGKSQTVAKVVRADGA